MDSEPLAQWLRRLEALHPSAIDLGLERVGQVAQRLGLLRPGVPAITVAGTNGKGSTVAVIEAVLCASGGRPGVYTSPHLLRFGERIRIGGRSAPDEDIIGAFAAIDRARGSISLTYFEFATLAALMLFRDAGADTLVLEVGLGGRLDATNVLAPDVAVITSIALDHQQWLGETRDEIALEKAGILRRGIPAVIADPDPPASLLSAAREQACQVLRYGVDFTVCASGPGLRVELRDNRGAAVCIDDLPVTRVLPVNLGAALQALSAAGLPLRRDLLLGALADLQLPGRRECRALPGGGQLLLDVAHNPAAASALREFLHSNPVSGRNVALFGPMADKDIAGVLDACADCFQAWFLPDQPALARASRGADVALLLRERGCGMISVCDSVGQAFEQARQLDPGDRLVVFGSFAPVAEVMALLGGEQREAAGG